MGKKQKKPIYQTKRGYSLPGNKKIYRYISLGQFIHLVQTKKLPFSSVTKWDDPNEGIITRGLLGYIEHSVKVSHPEKYDQWSNVIKEADKILSFVYGSSWTLIEESDALWRIYSPDKQGVKIQTNVAKLKSAAASAIVPSDWNGYRFSVGRVKYSGPKLYDIQITQAFLHKEEPFSHEREARVIIIPNFNVEDVDTLSKPKTIYSDIAHEFIESVTIDPGATSWLVDAVVRYCLSNKIHNCSQSNLYKEIEFSFRDSIFDRKGN